MSIGIEITIGNGKDKPKVVKTPDGTYVVRGVVPLQLVQYTRAIWIKSFVKGKELPKDGKGFLVTSTGRLSKG